MKTRWMVKAAALLQKCNEDGVDPRALLELHKVSRMEDLSEAQHSGIIVNWEKVKERCGNNRKA